MSEEALGQLARQWIAEHGRAGGTEMADDQDLLASGMLDSMGFIELLAYIETVTGQPLACRSLISTPVHPFMGWSGRFAGHVCRKGRDESHRAELFAAGRSI